MSRRTKNEVLCLYVLDLNPASGGSDHPAMPEPACLERARLVAQHAKYCGAPLRQFAVTVSKAEGFELLVWFRQNADPTTVDLQALDAAIADCVRHDDPFDVLSEFKLAGVDIIPQPN